MVTFAMLMTLITRIIRGHVAKITVEDPNVLQIIQICAIVRNVEVELLIVVKSIVLEKSKMEDLEGIDHVVNHKTSYYLIL